MTATGQTSAQIALQDPDVRLMQGVRVDEPGAFEQLVERYQRRLVAILHHLVGNSDEAEDLAQEVFLRVYRARTKYRARSKFSTWLFTIANNLAMNSLRSRHRKRVVSLTIRDSGPLGARPAEQMARERSGPVQRVQRQELATIVQEALTKLNERQRMAVVLNKFEDMNYAEIAEVMKLSMKAVKSLLSRARVNLRADLEAYIHMDGGPLPAPPDEEG